VVISGDFDKAEAKRLIEKYYGAIKSQQIPNRPRPSEPVQTSVRMLQIEKEVQSAQLMMAYPSPKSGADENYALDLLANILGTGPSSRLYQKLVYQEQIAAGVYVSNHNLQESGLFSVGVALKPGASVERVRRVVLSEMARARQVRVSPAELEKAKNQTMKGFVDGLKTTNGKAEALALNEILFGDYERLFTDLDRYSQVTTDDVKKVANKYLLPNKYTFAVLNPKVVRAKPQPKPTSQPASQSAPQQNQGNQ
jgi:predicted Zn-dependent peptidase